MVEYHNPLYIRSSEAEKTINVFLHIHKNRRDSAYTENLKKNTIYIWKQVMSKLEKLKTMIQNLNL